MSTPSDIESQSADVGFGKFSIATEILNFDKDPKKWIKQVPVLLGTKNIKLDLQGELSTNGILVNTDYNTHTVCFKFTDSDDLDGLIALEEKLDLVNVPESWERKALVKNECLWLKLKYDANKSAYQIKSNVKLNPKKPQDAILPAFQPVTAQANLMAFFNIRDETYGLSLTLLNLNVVGEDSKKK